MLNLQLTYVTEYEEIEQPGASPLLTSIHGAGRYGLVHATREKVIISLAQLPVLQPTRETGLQDVLAQSWYKNKQPLAIGFMAHSVKWSPHMTNAKVTKNLSLDQL